MEYCAAGRRDDPASVDGLSINIFSMSDLEDGHFVAAIIDEINDPVASLSHTIAIGVSSEFFRAC